MAILIISEKKKKTSRSTFTFTSVHLGQLCLGDRRTLTDDLAVIAWTLEKQVKVRRKFFK